MKVFFCKKSILNLRQKFLNSITILKELLIYRIYYHIVLLILDMIILVLLKNSILFISILKHIIGFYYVRY